MSYTQTPNYNLIKPNVNSDDDLWGDHTNQNWDQLDSIIHGIDTRPGGVASFNTRVGAVTLQGVDVTTALGYTPYNVTNPAGYQTAGQVTALLGGYLPLSGGVLTGAIGVPSGSQVAPAVAVGTADGTGMSRSGAALLFTAQGTASLALFAGGGQFYGPLNMLNAKVSTLGDATAAQDALNLRTADARYAGLASPAFTGNPTAPTPAPGDNDTSLATTAFVTAAVSAGSVAGVASFNTRTGAVVLSTTDVQSALGFAPAPLNAPIFTGDARAVTPAAGDADTSIATTAFVAAAIAPTANNAGRNLIHNATFTVAQRGAGPFTANNSYTADRWYQVSVSPDTVSTTIVALGDADRAAIGDETATSAIQFVVTGTSTGVTYFQQFTEALRRVGGKTLTVSFWAKAASGTPRVAINLLQNFGTGGSPSTAFYIGAVVVTISATWARYTATFAMPSVAGKTFGTNGNDCSAATFFLNGGSNANAGGIGTQSGTFSIWGVQLEIGAQATPLDYGGSPQQILAQCQRFYHTGAFAIAGSAAAGGHTVQMYQTFPVRMRATPTIASNTSTYTNLGGGGVATGGLDGPGYLNVNGGTTGAAGAYMYNGTYTASADL